MDLLSYGIVFAAGVLSSETVRRVWNAKVAPKLAELSSSLLK